MSIDFPKEEEIVLQRWKEIRAFERQVELSEGRPNYVFYDDKSKLPSLLGQI
jgi:isoleucyl-tRNA synthetase